MADPQFTEPQRERLASYIEQRVHDLNIEWKDIPARGGPSTAKVREFIRGRSHTFSAGKRRQLEEALDWRPGSFTAIAAGGEPEPIGDQTAADIELVSKLAHPSRRALWQNEPGADELTAILNQVMELGTGLDDGLRESITRVLDDQNIKSFPSLFETLTRERKLKVVRFGSRLYTEQNREERGIGQREEDDVLETTAEPSASSKAEEAREVSRHDPQPPFASGDPWARKYPRVDRDEDGEQGHQLPGG